MSGNDKQCEYAWEKSDLYFRLLVNFCEEYREFHNRVLFISEFIIPPNQKQFRNIFANKNIDKNKQQQLRKVVEPHWGISIKSLRIKFGSFEIDADKKKQRNKQWL